MAKRGKEEELQDMNLEGFDPHKVLDGQIRQWF